MGTVINFCLHSNMNQFWSISLILVLFFTGTKSLYRPSHRYIERQEEKTTWLSDWPCPLAEEISPCTCGQTSPGKLQVICKDVVDIEEINRIFSVEFPFNNLEEITLIVNDNDLWINHSDVTIPQNVFQDKTASRIWISMKVVEVHPKAFENMGETLTELSISGAGMVDGEIPLDYFPIYMLNDFPNLKWFMLQSTMLSDTTFEKKPAFSDLVLPNIEYLHFAGGMLTHIPKLCIAPNLREIRFAYNPIASIEIKAFDHLPNLEILDIEGNGESVPGIEQTLEVLRTDSLAMSSAVNFSTLLMGEWEHLQYFEPGFITNIKPHTSMDFMGKQMGKIEMIPEESFRDLFEVLAETDRWPAVPGHINFGRNGLLCDCSIKWIVEKRQFLKVIDWENAPSYARPTCMDGTLVADLDLDVLDALCP